MLQEYLPETIIDGTYFVYVYILGPYSLNSINHGSNCSRLEKYGVHYDLFTEES